MLKHLFFSVFLGLALLFSTPSYSFTNTNDSKQIECLARNAYFEARGEGERGIIAVTHVVLNRTNDKRSRFGTTPCAVVHQKTKGHCQFSWVCKTQTITNYSLYTKCKEIVKAVYYKQHSDNTNGALFYHAKYVSGSWFKSKLMRTVQIGSHIFYKG